MVTRWLVDVLFVGSIYARSTMILSATTFRVTGLFNNGYGWKAGNWMGGYQMPQTSGISIITYLDGLNMSRSFGIDLDMYNGLNFHHE